MLQRIASAAQSAKTSIQQDTLKALIGFVQNPESAPDFPTPPTPQSLTAAKLVKNTIAANFLNEVLVQVTTPCP
jgi:hypothetical protein